MPAAKKLLSQDEMDALLDGVQQGNVPGAGAAANAGPADVQAFDFKAQEVRLPTLAVLPAVHERLTRQLPLALSLIYGCDIEASQAAPRALRFGDYVSSLSVPASINRVRVKPLNLDAYVVFDAGLVAATVNHLFGGDARFQSTIERPALTPLEQHLVERVLTSVLTELREAWAPSYPLQFEFVQPESEPSVTGGVAVTAFDVRLKDQGGQLHIALPAPVIAGLRDRLQSAGARTEGDSAWAVALREALHDVVVSVNCTMVETQLALREVVQLKAGDVIPIELPPQVVLQAEGQPAYYANYGVSRGTYAVKTTQPLPASRR